MKGTFGRALCLLLALLLPAVGALAATPLHECGDYTYIILPGGDAQIVDWEGRDRALKVPGVLDGHPVASVSECAFCGCAGLQSVALPEGLWEIGENAFEGCAALEQVRLPASLRRLGSYAFKGCESLVRVALPGALSEVGDNPFLDCANLSGIEAAPDAAGLVTVDGVLFTRADARLVCYPMGLEAVSYAVPEGVRAIGARAFDGALCLETLTLPASLSEIGRDAFSGCTGLRVGPSGSAVTLRIN